MNLLNQFFAEEKQPQIQQKHYLLQRLDRIEKLKCLATKDRNMYGIHRANHLKKTLLEIILKKQIINLPYIN